MKKLTTALTGLALGLSLVLAGWAAAPTSAAVPDRKPHVGTAPKGPTKKEQKIGAAVIDINHASAKDLAKVPGIGSKTAGKIVKNRPYSTVDDLVTKKVLSAKQLAKMKSHLTATP